MYIIPGKINFDEEDILHIAELDFKKYIVFSIWDEPEKVDFLTRGKARFEILSDIFDEFKVLKKVKFILLSKSLIFYHEFRTI